MQNLIEKLQLGDKRALARAISLVENGTDNSKQLLEKLNPNSDIPVIGITGPPGAGKSSLVSALANNYIQNNLKIAILAVDPSSPFGTGSILGDRLRMDSLYNLPDVFIRSVSSRGSLGGLFAQVIEIVELLKSAPFDVIIIETVGVGQSEVEIAGIADITVVVLVPESGDDIQTLKSGIMEVGDLFVVNKSDRPGADLFANYLKEVFAERDTLNYAPLVFQTSVLQNIGIADLAENILTQQVLFKQKITNRKSKILSKKVLQLIMKEKLKDLPMDKIEQQLIDNMNKPDFQLFRFTQNILKSL